MGILQLCYWFKILDNFTHTKFRWYTHAHTHTHTCHPNIDTYIFIDLYTVSTLYILTNLHTIYTFTLRIMIPRSLFVLALPLKKNINSVACFLSQCWSLRSRITILCLDGVRSGLSQISHVQMMCVLHLEIYGGQKMHTQISSNILNSARSHSEFMRIFIYKNKSMPTHLNKLRSRPAWHC